MPSEWALAIDDAARGVMVAAEGRSARPRTSRTYRRVIGAAALLLSLSESSSKRGWARVVHGFSREAIVSMLPANEDTGRSLHANTWSNYAAAFVGAGWLEKLQPDGAAIGSGVERGPSGHAFNQYRIRPPSSTRGRQDGAQELARAIVDSTGERGGISSSRRAAHTEGLGPDEWDPVTTDVDPAPPRGKQINSAGPIPSG